MASGLEPRSASNWSHCAVAESSGALGSFTRCEQVHEERAERRINLPRCASDIVQSMSLRLWCERRDMRSKLVMRRDHATAMCVHAGFQSRPNHAVDAVGDGPRLNCPIDRTIGSVRLAIFRWRLTCERPLGLQALRSLDRDRLRRVPPRGRAMPARRRSVRVLFGRPKTRA